MDARGKGGRTFRAGADGRLVPTSSSGSQPSNSSGDPPYLRNIGVLALLGVVCAAVVLAYRSRLRKRESE